MTVTKTFLVGTGAGPVYALFSPLVDIYSFK